MIEYRQHLGFLFSLSYLFQQKLELAEDRLSPPASSKEVSFSGATGAPTASSVLLLGPRKLLPRC